MTEQRIQYLNYYYEKNIMHANCITEQDKYYKNVHTSYKLKINKFYAGTLI